MQTTTQPVDDEALCQLCWNDHTAQFWAPNYRNGVAVCGTHASALEDGSWEHGETYEVTPITDREAEYVFVYGTLQDGSGSHAELAGWRKDNTGRYPTLVPDPDGVVTGELHKVTPARLEQLDSYEGVPRLYKRVEAPMGVWVYIGDPQRLGSHVEVPFEQSYLEERMNEATLTLAADFNPREMSVEGE
jgi:gamma-glutamylcyclotransferase (GGCT)/AIG2-like uncharacterized protein YtfP